MEYINKENLIKSIEDNRPLNWNDTEAELAEQRAYDDIIELIKDFNDDESDRINELAEADKEGVCLVLPCKVGDTVYRVLYSCHNADHSEIKRCDECEEECDIKKTIISFIVPDLDWIITNYYAFQNGIWKTTKEEADVERWRGWNEIYNNIIKANRT